MVWADTPEGGRSLADVHGGFLEAVRNPEKGFPRETSW
jgi:hypothetical protein